MDLIVVTPEQFEKQKNVVGTIVRETVQKGKLLMNEQPEHITEIHRWIGT